MAEKYNIDRTADRWTKLSQAQDNTVNELITMLDKHSIALMIRPTGFGKTHLMIDLAKREKYEKVLYLYPLDVIKQSIYESYHKDENIKFTDNEEEHNKYPELPYIEFCTYDKMLEDYNNVYRFEIINNTGKEWAKLSKDEKLSIQSKWDKLSDKDKAKLRAKWIKNRFEHIELLILDEAHRTGAEGFKSYWPDIHKLTSKGLKANRLHVLGATATPLRTQGDIDIEEEIFYFEYGGEKKSARISDFGMEYCWRYNILKRPYYIRGILNKEEEKQEVLVKVKADEKKIKATIDSKLSDVSDELDDLLLNIKDASSVILSGVKHVCQNTVDNHDYIRLLVFHSDSASMIKYHDEINNAIRNAFVNNEIGYKNINTYYITSDIADIKNAGIEISKVGVISDRDTEIKNNPDAGQFNIDIIHSIDMLNMGYHVGKVTGIITRRKTGSEIIYYQQIGRCISVAADNQPLIIDLANAAAELYDRTSDSQRDEAVKKIKLFIEGCNQDKAQNNAVDNFYKYINMCLDMTPIDPKLVEFWYLDRKAPIYFIYAISKALGKKETLESLLTIIDDEVERNNEYIILDTEFCLDIARIHKNIKKNYIMTQPDKLKRARQKVKL